MISLVSMRDLQTEQLRELQEGERRIAQMLPGMICLAWHESLAVALRSQLAETTERGARLAVLLQQVESVAWNGPSDGLDGMLAEIAGSMSGADPNEVLDAALIIELRRLMHVTIAGYTTLIALAEATGDLATARPVRQMLEEMIDAEHRLALLARNEVNPDGALAGVPDEARRLGIGLEWTDFST